MYLALHTYVMEIFGVWVQDSRFKIQDSNLFNHKTNKHIQMRNNTKFVNGRDQMKSKLLNACVNGPIYKKSTY